MEGMWGGKGKVERGGRLVVGNGDGGRGLGFKLHAACT